MHERSLGCLVVLTVTAACNGGGRLADTDGETGETGDGDGDDPGDGDGDDPGEPFEAVSILLVVDNSGSMGRAQWILAERTQDLLEPLDAAGIPWRLGITTTDAGNPWCTPDISSPENGKLVLSSCASRIEDDFMVEELTVEGYACLDLCAGTSVTTIPTPTDTDPQLLARPWIESDGSQTNLADGAALEDALQCVIPQGVVGCGFESPLRSAQLSVARAKDVDEAEYGFVEPGRLLVVVFVTDEADCSYAPEWSQIFEQDGNRAFWSDPLAEFPTSAVCWNAGMQCTGDPSNYDDCVPVDRDVDGNPTDDPNLAVMRPVQNVIEGLGDPDEVRVFGIVGVGADGQPHYADVTNTDPEYQSTFGIGPGCTAPPPLGSSDPVTAVPPGRIWTVLEQPSPSSGQRAWSICDENFNSALAAIGDAIAAEF